ncbi:MAG: hypothetical protein ACFFD4_04005 [Candidatus Odinarchaeota archaeon]
MSRFIYLAPGFTKKRCKTKLSDSLDLNPLVISTSCTSLIEGIIIHAIEDDTGGLNAYGILEDNKLEINIRLRSEYHRDFEQRFFDDLRCRSHSGPVLIFEQPFPKHFKQVLNRSVNSSNLKTIRAGFLPTGNLLDLVGSYPKGLATQLEEENTAPDSTTGVRELVAIIKHSITCKLATHSFRNNLVQRYSFETTCLSHGIDHYLALEACLPVSFDGTVVRLLTTGITPGTFLLAAGFLVGHIARIYFNSDLSSNFHQLVIDRLKGSPGPHAAYHKRLIENWLCTEIDIGLNQSYFTRNHWQFRNLLAGFNPGKEEIITDQIQLYLNRKNPHWSRELARRDILSQVLTNLMFDCLSAFDHAENHWRVTANDLELFVNSKSSKQAIEKFKKRDHIRRRKTRKGLIDYTCRKPRGRLVKGSKLAKRL